MNEFLCINDVFTTQQKQSFESLPVKGEKYTLKEEVVSLIDGKKGYVFYELPNPSHPNGQEYSFRPSRFKEALSREVSLVKEKEKEKEMVEIKS
ncbi:hypothetical protein [Segetibacter sp.]|jgi:hypothetical protein|uniref:hypothetical protein n=1 Tax=Segetibacter sp. TaxID=2231182 RepID=UPI00262AC240|nr:hypothetical protein [Segetibacter sp.]MCW3080365.1 hypothetical protein [Segetibacter sp.]